MLTTATITDHVHLASEVRVIRILICKDAVSVVLEDLSNPANKTGATLQWDKLNDIESYVTLFENERVKTFVRLTELLATAYRNRHIYEALS